MLFVVGALLLAADKKGKDDRKKEKDNKEKIASDKGNQLDEVAQSSAPLVQQAQEPYDG